MVVMHIFYRCLLQRLCTHHIRCPGLHSWTNTADLKNREDRSEAMEGSQAFMTQSFVLFKHIYGHCWLKACGLCFVFLIKQFPPIWMSGRSPSSPSSLMVWPLRHKVRQFVRFVLWISLYIYLVATKVVTSVNKWLIHISTAPFASIYVLKAMYFYG